MSTETKTNETPETKPSAEPVQQERKLSVDDVEAEAAEDVKGGGISSVIGSPPRSDGTVGLPGEMFGLYQL